MADILSRPYFEMLQQRANRLHREMLDRVAESLDRIAISEELLRKPIYRAPSFKPTIVQPAAPDQTISSASKSA